MTTMTYKPRSIDPESPEAPHASIEDVRQDLTALKTDVSGAVRGAAESGVDLAKEFTTRAKEQHMRLCEGVKSRPTTSLLIAAGVGAILARMLTR